MNYEYDAFISYRHLENDKAVAEKLQVLLETYKPPRGGQYANTTRIKRIFRDESELPTSGDLGGDIARALEASGFLIVICSETTKDSMWCMQEIQQFKELHNGSCENILPILISGEPEDSFSHSLRHETRRIMDANGEMTEREVEIEPLAADIRADSKRGMLKRLSTEFLRIAAPILGCSYDNLYRRHQRRFLRRVFQYTAIFVIATVLASGYVIYSQGQIAEQERIAAEQERIASEQRIIAQGEKTMRTLKVAENLIESNEKVLASAILSDLAEDIQYSEQYEKEVERLLLQSTYVPQFSCYTFLNHDDLIICLDIDKDILISYSRNGTISMWNIISGELIGKTDISYKIVAMVYENSLLYAVTEDTNIIIWNTETREIIDEFRWFTQDNASPAFHASPWPFSEFPVDIMLYNNTLYLAIPNSEIFVLSISLETKTPDILFYDEDDRSTVFFIQSIFDKENKLIYGNTGDDFYVCNLITGEIDRFPALGRTLYEFEDGLRKYNNGIHPSKYKESKDHGIIAWAEDTSIALFSLTDAAIEKRISETPEYIYGTHTRESDLDSTGNLENVEGGDSSFFYDFKTYKAEAVSADGHFAIIEIETEEKPEYIADNVNRLYSSEISYYSYWVADCLTGERLYSANIPISFAAIDIKDDTIATVLTEACYVIDINMRTGEIIASAGLSDFSLSGMSTPFIMKFRVNYEKDIVFVASLLQDRETNEGYMWSKTTGEMLLDYSDINKKRYIGFDKKASRIYKYLIDDAGEAVDILEIELPDYERLLELSRVQVAGRTASEKEKTQLGLK